MGNVGSKVRAILNLLVAVILIAPPLFAWWKLSYLYNLPDGGSALVWKIDKDSRFFEDYRKAGTVLRYQGKLKRGEIERESLVRLSWSAPSVPILAALVMLVWGVVELYLCYYYAVRSRMIRGGV